MLALMLAAVAPIAGLVGAYGTTRAWDALRLRTPLGRQARRAHWLGLVLQAFAYGANDGQKMLTVLALALPAAMDRGRVVPRLWLLGLLGPLFTVGMVAGIHRYSRRLNGTLGTFGPVHGVTAQFSAAVTVTCSAAVGAPVSMTQVITGGCIGSGLTQGIARVRWQHAARIVGTWVLTLPIATLVVAPLLRS